MGVDFAGSVVVVVVVVEFDGDSRLGPGSPIAMDGTVAKSWVGESSWCCCCLHTNIA